MEPFCSSLQHALEEERRRSFIAAEFNDIAGYSAFQYIFECLKYDGQFADIYLVSYQRVFTNEFI